MAEINRVLELNPAPSILVAIVRHLVERPWPRSDEERDNLFTRLSFKPGARHEPPHDGSSCETTELDVGDAGQVNATWSSYNGGFMGVTFRLYGSSDPEAISAHRGQEELVGLLTEAYGNPGQQWGDEEMPPSIWTINGRTITSHLDIGANSAVLLSVEDSNLSTAAEIEAQTR